MIFAIPADAAAMPAKPKKAAINATTKKPSAQRNIVSLLLETLEVALHLPETRIVFRMGMKARRFLVCFKGATENPPYLGSPMCTHAHRVAHDTKGTKRRHETSGFRCMYRSTRNMFCLTHGVRYRTPLRLSWAIVVTLVILFPYCSCSAYSVLTHEAIIDSAWDGYIRPALLQRFPDTTREQLKEAHAYAYGGAIVQDLGYYPHGSKMVSDLTHYVRSGDFVEALLRDSKNVNEYAFALGAMAHYVADNLGHKMGTNRSVPVLYPKLRKKYGKVVTYEDDPLAHLKAEFGFDVLEVAKQRYAPDSYRDFIGFAVAQPLLDQAFQETYGIDLKTLFGNEDRAIGSYRYAVSSLIPRATRVAWHIKRDEIQRDLPGTTKKKFLYNLSRASYEKKWGKDYQQPTFGDRLLADLYYTLPKIGPLRILTFRTPTPETEQFFEASFNATLERYQSLLSDVKQHGAVHLPNDNIDVGEVTARGQYRLYDTTCADLLNKLAARNFADASRELRAELLRFYSEPAGPGDAKLKKKDRVKLESNLRQLKTAAGSLSAGQNGQTQLH